MKTGANREICRLQVAVESSMSSESKIARVRGSVEQNFKYCGGDITVEAVHKAL